MDAADRRWVNSMSDAYDLGLAGAVFAPFARDLAARAGQFTPKTVLELAAGTGALTRELSGWSDVEVVATDLNDAMVTVGAARAAGARWQQADACNLPFNDASFDLVACQFGVMFFPDKPVAFAEMRRVLTDRGSCLLNAWGRLVDHGFETSVVTACDRLFPADPPVFLRSVPHFYGGKVEALVADVEAGGLHVVDAQEIVLQSPPADPIDVATGYCLGTPLRGEIEARGGDMNTVVAAVAAEIAQTLGGDVVTAAMSAYIVTAVA